MQLKKVPEKKAFKKGWEIIRSCKNPTHIHIAYNWIWLYKKMYGETEDWKTLYKFCTRRRKRL